MRVKNRKKAVAIYIASLSVIGIAVYFFVFHKAEDAFVYEENITVGDMPGVDREALLAALQANTDEAAVAFSINSKPAVVGRKMRLLFENPEGNGKDVTLAIYENDTGEIIYQSKAIREGNHLATVELLKEYAPGEYEVTAQITALDIETHNVIGETAAGLTLQVLDS